MIGFPYNYGDELSEEKAGENFKLFLKNYGPKVLSIGFFILSTSAFASDGAGAPSPKPDAPAPNQCAPAPAPKVLPATKELVGIAAVGLVCAAAASNPVTAMGIAACLLTIAAKACNKL